MKKVIVLLALVASTSMGFSQIDDSLPPWFRLDPIEKFNPSFKATITSLYAFSNKAPSVQTSTYNAKLANYMNSFEQGIRAGKTKGLLNAESVQRARKQHPGKTPAAIRRRLKMYAKEMGAMR